MKNIYNQFVIFKIYDRKFALNILKVKEIIKYKEFCFLPESPEYIEGVINLRGKIIPIMNIQKRMNIHNKGYNNNWKILILNTGTFYLGVLIEKVVEIKNILIETIEEPSEMMKAQQDFIKGIAKIDDKIVSILDINKLK